MDGIGDVGGQGRVIGARERDRPRIGLAGDRHRRKRSHQRLEAHGSAGEHGMRTELDAQPRLAVGSLQG